ncbi:hypothetical protein QBC38DRAFT_517461 [Podospora fimiseda]|uniref:Uncharacterized protein n=1 Tax=Podospora fimiseda TaxID=252190 RepID=A0AAN7H3Q2_9PEZI|nr:hypothetical protein QBC38DRAFT_517461 [Podospora fimiseda]
MMFFLSTNSTANMAFRGRLLRGHVSTVFSRQFGDSSIDALRRSMFYKTMADKYCAEKLYRPESEILHELRTPPKTHHLIVLQRYEDHVEELTIAIPLDKGVTFHDGVDDKGVGPMIFTPKGDRHIFIDICQSLQPCLMLWQYVKSQDYLPSMDEMRYPMLVIDDISLRVKPTLNGEWTLDIIKALDQDDTEKSTLRTPLFKSYALFYCDRWVDPIITFPVLGFKVKMRWSFFEKGRRNVLIDYSETE